VKDKWVNQESRTLDPERRDPAGRAQKGNNGFRRPYIRPQSAGSRISRSRGVEPSISVKVPSEQSVKQVIYEGATPSESSEAAPWEAYKEQDRYVETFGIGSLGISELRHKWLTSGRHHTAKSKRLFSNFVTTTPWRDARRVCQRQAKEAYDEEPSAWGGQLSETQRDGRAVDRFAVSRGVRLESPAITGEFPNSNRPTSRMPEHRASGQETAQRTSAATPAEVSGSHVTIAARSSLGSAGASRTSSIKGKPGARQVSGGSLDCQRDLSKNLAGPSGTEPGTGIASKGVGLESKACSP